MNALPAYLADRAYDMRGPRGVNMRKRDGNLDNVPERKQSGPTDPKRKYTRRGQSLLEIQQLQQQSHPQQSNIQQSLPSQQPLPQQQPPQQSSHQEAPPQQQSLQFSLQQYQQPPPSQQPLTQQSLHQEVSPQQQTSQFLQYQPFNSLDIPSTSGATIFENLEYVLINEYDFVKYFSFEFNIFLLFSGLLHPYSPLFKIHFSVNFNYYSYFIVTIP